MIGVYNYADQKNPVQFAEFLKQKADESGFPAKTFVNPDKDKAILSMMITSGDKPPITKELNLFKFETAQDGSIIALQYARRYTLNNENDIKALNEDVKNNHQTRTDWIAKTPVPDLVFRNIDLVKK